jgi:autotransporter-associated beta strand protein
LNNKYTGTGGAVASTFGIFNRTFTLTGANTGSNTIYSALGNSTGGGALGIAKSGSGSWILAGTNTYTGPTTVSNGTLLVNGSLALVSVVTVFGGTLGGTGIIGGSVAVHANASLSPGNPLGALTINGNLTLAADSMTRIVVVHSPLTNNSTHISGVLTEAGSLIVTNIGGTALAAGDSFKLFSAASYNGAFDSMNLPPLSAGLGWNTDFLNSNGTLSVVVASSPMLGSVSISGGSLVFKGSGGVAGAHFYLLGSTNLSAPPSQWTRLLTNQFDTSGNFSFTWPLSSNTPQFYLLEVP